MIEFTAEEAAKLATVRREVRRQRTEAARAWLNGKAHLFLPGILQDIRDVAHGGGFCATIGRTRIARHIVGDPQFPMEEWAKIIADTNLGDREVVALAADLLRSAGYSVDDKQDYQIVVSWQPEDITTASPPPP